MKYLLVFVLTMLMFTSTLFAQFFPPSADQNNSAGKVQNNVRTQIVRDSQNQGDSLHNAQIEALSLFYKNQMDQINKKDTNQEKFLNDFYNAQMKQINQKTDSVISKAQTEMKNQTKTTECSRMRNELDVINEKLSDLYYYYRLYYEDTMSPVSPAKISFNLCMANPETNSDCMGYIPELKELVASRNKLKRKIFDANCESN